MSQEEQLVDEREEDSADYTTITKSGHKVACTASRGMRDVVSLYATIDDIFHTFGETRFDGSSMYSEARREAEIVTELLDAGMIRRKDDGWEVARNAKLPVPADWEAKRRE